MLDEIIRGLESKDRTEEVLYEILKPKKEKTIQDFREYATFYLMLASYKWLNHQRVCVCRSTSL